MSALQPFDPVPKAIVFDLDDTLCAYWDAAKQGLLKAFQLEGPEGFAPEQMIVEWAQAFQGFYPRLRPEGWYEKYLVTGEPTRTEQMQLALLRVGIDDPDRAARLGEAYRREREAALVLFDDALEVLDLLKDKFQLAMITNGPADIQRAEARVLGIEQYFDPLLIEGEVGFGKPDPRIFKIVEDRTGFSGKHVLMVGNNYKADIEPAVLRGWRTVWLRRPSDVPPSAEADAKPEPVPGGGPMPDVILPDLKSILPLLAL